MNPNLMKQSTGFSMEPSDLVTFLLEDEVDTSFKSKGMRGAIVCLEPKHRYNSSFSSHNPVVATLH